MWFLLFIPFLVFGQSVNLFCKSVEDMYKACSSVGSQGVDCQQLGSQVYNKMLSGTSPKNARDFSVLCTASCIAEQTKNVEVKRDIEDYIKRCKEGNP